MSTMLMSEAEKYAITRPFDRTSGESFWEYILDQTKAVHKLAEGSGSDEHFFSRLRSEKISKADYADYIGILFFLYEGLEKQAENPEINDSVRALVSKFSRKESLKNDYKMFTDFDVEKQPILSEITKIEPYVKHLEAIGKDSFKLLAHLFTRYGGDISGGRIMFKRLVKIGWDPKMLSFSHFGEKEEMAALFSWFKDMINRIPEDYPGCEEAFIHEVTLAFLYNEKILSEFSAVQVEKNK